MSGIDQLKLPRTVPGLGDNLLTVTRPAANVARVRCVICGCEVGCRVVASVKGGNRDTMSLTDFAFWLAHFQSRHPGVLPPEVEAEL